MTGVKLVRQERAYAGDDTIYEIHLDGREIGTVRRVARVTRGYAGAWTGRLYSAVYPELEGYGRRASGALRNEVVQTLVAKARRVNAERGF